MFIKQTRKKLKGKTYSNYLLVESVATPRGPRHRVVCSLGSLAPAPTTTLDATLGCVMPVDVEGFEDRVLRGMSAILSRWRPAIVVECNPDGPHRQVEQILGDELYVFYHLGPHGPERKPRPGTIKPILGKRGEPSSWLKPDGGRIIQTGLRFRVLPSPQEQE